MKALLAIPLFVLGMATSAHADNLIAVKNVSIDVIGGGGIAAVQPYAMLNVTVNSCGRRNLSLEITDSDDGAKLIKVLDDNAMDCEAVGTDKVYNLQISSDASFFQKYILLNPIAINYQR
jgi:hypothetical protein